MPREPHPRRMVRQAEFQCDFIPGMTLDSAHDHLSCNTVELTQDPVQKQLAVQFLNLAGI